MMPYRGMQGLGQSTCVKGNNSPGSESKTVIYNSKELPVWIESVPKALLLCSSGIIHYAKRGLRALSAADSFMN